MIQLASSGHSQVVKEQTDLLDAPLVILLLKDHWGREERVDLACVGRLAALASKP